jgi:hypothetical protein
VQPKHQRIDSYFKNQSINTEVPAVNFEYLKTPPLTQQRESKKDLSKNGSRTKQLSKNGSRSSLNEKSQNISSMARNIKILETQGGQEGGITNRTRENQRVETMIEARKKQKASMSMASKQSSEKTMNNTRGSRNMVYEYNKSSQIVTKE